MKRATKFKMTPKIVQAIEHDGCETIYQIGSHTFIEYEGAEGKVYLKSGFNSDGKFYRKVESEDRPGIVTITTTSPDNFIFVNHYYEPIEETE